MPLEIYQELHSAYLLAAAQNSRRYLELKILNEEFQRANIPIILLKGMYLASVIYSDIGVRPMNDADLLVRKSDLERVANIMQEMEYNRIDQLKELDKEYHHLVFEHGSSGSPTEIHWNLIPPILNIHEDIDQIWERSREMLVEDIPVRVLSAEDQVLLLCLHVSQHAFEIGLRPICDLSKTIRYYQETLDWDCLHKRALEWNAGRCLYVNLCLARDLLNDNLPAEWLDGRIPAGFESHYLATAREHLFASMVDPEKVLGSGAHFVQFWATNSKAEKIKLFWKSIFRSRQSLAMDYQVPPNSLRIYLYYLVHLRDLLRKYGRFGWRLLRGDRQTVAVMDWQEKVNSLKGWLFSE